MKTNLPIRRLLTIATLACGLSLMANTAAFAQLKLRDICRVKGQEENILHGLGLVVGLKGTGDSDFRPTSRALATLMSLMGNPLDKGPRNEDLLRELKDAKNVALVSVTMIVPPAGARQGDKVNCVVNAISAKSLEGGTLMLTPLLGPRPGNQRVYALAQGMLQIDDAAKPNSARIFQGGRIEEDFFNPFVKDGKITLVLGQNHAGFHTAQEIADLINTQSYFQGSESHSAIIARAIDSVNIEVKIPTQYAAEPVSFVSQILSQRIVSPQTEARVVINERAQSVVIGDNVEIGPVAVTHKNIILIETGSATLGNRFVPVDTTRGTTKLKTLVETLNGIKVPTADIIEIIKGLERTGKLYGQLIIE